MNTVMRTLGGATGTESIPQRLVVNSSAASKNPFSSLTDYPQKFLAAWRS